MYGFIIIIIYLNIDFPTELYLLLTEGALRESIITSETTLADSLPKKLHRKSFHSYTLH